MKSLRRANYLRFYVVTRNGQVGPTVIEDLQDLLIRGIIEPSDQVRSGFGVRLGTVDEIRTGKVKIGAAAISGKDDSSHSRDAIRQSLRFMRGVVPASVFLLALVLSLCVLMWAASASKSPAQGVGVPAPSEALQARAPASVAAAQPEPSVSAMRGERLFVRGIALGGEEVTIDGQRWLGHDLALANGLALGTGTTVAPRAPIAAPRLDFDTKSMLDGGLIASGQVRLSQELPNGDYEVTVWVAGAQGVDPALLTLRLGGTEVATGTTTGAPTWARLGPHFTSVSKRKLDIGVSGLSGAHLAGVAIAALGRGEATVPPVVSLTSPGADAQLYSGDITLVAEVVPANGGIAAVEFFDGTTRLGTATSRPYTFHWRKPAIGRHRLSAVVTDTAAVYAGSAPISVTIKADDGSRELSIERAKDALRALGLESSLLAHDNDGWRLSLADNQVISDVSWLKGVPLTSLDLRGTKVSDFSVLAGMPLSWLCIDGTRPHDLAFLNDLPLVELHIMNCAVADLAPLAGLKLKVLAAGDNPVTTLAPLARMKLHSLSIKGDPIEDFLPLVGMPIEDLDASGTKVRDLILLAGLPLNILRIKDCPVNTLVPLTGMHLQTLDMTRVNADLAPLKGMPLESLCIDDAHVRDLAPLTGMPLHRLDMWGCPETSLAPLVGMPLEALLMSHSAVTDLAPIAGMPLIHLDLRACERLESLAPVATLSKLRYLYLPNARPAFDTLRALVNVQVREEGNDQLRDIRLLIKAWEVAQGRK
jgi:hypothetical protein